MTTPLISIIVPVYNVETYLPRCLDSIINQTYKNLEIIVVNDGSTDNSAFVCREYATRDARITVVNKSNGGLFSARNAGMDIMKGDFFGFIDSDDYIDPVMFEKLLNATQNYNADLAECGLCIVNGDGTIKRRIEFENIVYDGNYECAKMWLLGCNSFGTAWNKLYRTQKFSELRFKYKFTEDHYMLGLVYQTCTKKCSISGTYYNYVRRAQSLSGNKFNMNKLESLNACQDVINMYKDKYPDLLRYTIDDMLIVITIFHSQIKHSTEANRDIILEKLDDMFNNGFKKIVACGKISFKENLSDIILLRIFLFHISPSLHDLLYKFYKLRHD